MWRYQYPPQGDKNVFAYEEMVVPLGMTVILRITSDDVAHSWWIPALGGKMDAVPGYVNKTWFKATKVGTYRGQCAEFCGLQHANMAFSVVAQPRRAFEHWLHDMERPARQPRSAAARLGKQVFMSSQCASARTEADRGSPLMYAISPTNSPGSISPRECSPEGVERKARSLPFLRM